MSQSQYGIETLYLFPIYSSRANYRAKTGKEAPPWNPLKPIKAWIDESIVSKPRGFVYYDVVETDEANNYVAGPDGCPVIKSWPVALSEAGKINLPDEDGTFTQDQLATAVPVPIRKLRLEEELVFFGPGNVVLVRNKILYRLEMEQAAVFLGSDRAILLGLELKLNKVLAHLGIAP